MNKRFHKIAYTFAAVLTLAAVAAVPVSCTVGGTSEPGSVTLAPTPQTTPETTPEPTPVNGKAAADGKVMLYQLAPEASSLMMSYVIKTAGGKIVVIDGGIDGTGLEREPYLPSAIRAILGLKEGEYFEVEAWFLSHHHKDHFNELSKMLNRYDASSNYRINNFYFAFPDVGVEWKSSAGEKDYDLEKAAQLKEGMDRYFAAAGFNGIDGADIPESDWVKPADAGAGYYYGLINGAVINDANVEKGLAIDVDGVTFNVLQKWTQKAQNVNSTSTVIRMVYKEHSVLFLGDSYIDNASTLLKTYGADALKSEYVQMGHHGQGGPSKKFYTSIDTQNSKRLWPTPKWVWEVDKSGPYHTWETRKWIGLPEDYREFEAQGLGDSGQDFVTGLYKAFPSDPASTASWTAEVLDAQRVGCFD